MLTTPRTATDREAQPKLTILIKNFQNSFKKI